MFADARNRAVVAHKQRELRSAGALDLRRFHVRLEFVRLPIHKPAGREIGRTGEVTREG